MAKNQRDLFAHVVHHVSKPLCEHNFTTAVAEKSFQSGTKDILWLLTGIKRPEEPFSDAYSDNYSENP